jgi:catechol 2,3-dioxygenase-like lactoylglutathione lyase family enzyme
MSARSEPLVGLTGVRIARDCQALAPMAAFYRELGLAEESRFVDHDGYDGVIFRLADGPAGWLQWELTQGPAHGTAEPHGGWELASTADAGHDPDGFRAQWPQPNPPCLRRRSLRPAECADFYGTVLGLSVPDRSAAVRISLPQSSLELDATAAADFRPPSVEDLLVFYFDSAEHRDQVADRVAASGAPAGRPGNPWWHRCARCFADPDGYLIALAFD